MSETSRLSLRLSNLKAISPDYFAPASGIALGIQPKLLAVDLRNNRLTSLPEQICTQVLLRECKLDYNFLYTLPHGLHKLTRLEHLSASQNNLKFLPQTLFQLRHCLQHLIVNDNKITSVSARIGNLQELRSLYLHNNQIKAVPSTLYRLGRRLQQFSLDWFVYLNEEYLPTCTKILKAKVLTEDKAQAGDARHAKILKRFLGLCSLAQVHDFCRYVEAAQSE